MNSNMILTTAERSPASAAGWRLPALLLSTLLASGSALAATAPDPVWPLNDTGLDWWADDATNFLTVEPASHPDQDASFGRDAALADDSDGQAGFVFTKLDVSGAPLSADAEEWACVRDEVTGLVWESKTQDAGLHDRLHRYTWYQSDSTRNGGNAGVEDDPGARECSGHIEGQPSTYCNTQAFAARVNAEGLCGQDDWRLPTVEELHSIIDYSRHNSALDPIFFPDSHPDTAILWSSASAAWNLVEAWTVVIDFGYDWLRPKTEAHPVRLVRGGRSLADGYRLSLALSGGEHGRVTSDPAGIDCGDQCEASFPRGSSLTLTAAPDAGYRAVWGGACSGTELTCELTLDADTSVTLSFNDNDAPVVTPPADITTEATAVQTVVDIGTASSDDGSLVSSDAPAAFPLGETLVTWSATDSAGNTGTAIQRVTVVDTTPPVLTLPPDISVVATGESTPVNIGSASATDIFAVTITNDAPAGFPVGDTLVIWTATDVNGNRASGVQRVTLTDEETPVEGPNLRHGVLEDVGDAWQTVVLPGAYANPVVVATVQYDRTRLPAVARVRNATGDRFELRVQNPSDAALSGGYRVHYLVAEAGVYTQAEHGVKLEAVKVQSSRTDSRANGWVGQAASYANSYVRPVVIGQVMTENDLDWSVFWARGAHRGIAPSASRLFVGKHVGEDPDGVRMDETLGYLVFEAGQSRIDALVMTAGVSSASIAGVANTPPYGVTHGLTSAVTGILSSAAMVGTDGGWPILYGAAPLADRQLDLAIDEDQVQDAERIHAGEPVSYVVFSAPTVDAGPRLYSGRLDAVGDSWQPVVLPVSYSDPVVVASVQSDSGLPPAVARVRRAAGNGFELRVQNPSGEPLGADYRVHYLVAEAGVYTEAEHGIKLEAVKVSSSITDSQTNGWLGQSATYRNRYSAPVVLGQVMSENDARWSVFWSRGANRWSVANTNTLFVGKHAGEDPQDSRAPETLGYLVLEAGTRTLGGLRILAAVSPVAIGGTGNAPPYSVTHSLANATQAVVSSAAMLGTDGGWPILYGDATPSAGRLDLAIEEDQVRDSETMHVAEPVSYLVVEPTGE